MGQLIAGQWLTDQDRVGPASAGGGLQTLRAPITAQQNE
jgi:hypothetical protein